MRLITTFVLAASCALTGPAAAAIPDASCVIEQRDAQWSRQRGIVHPSMTAANMAAEAKTPNGAPIGDAVARLVRTTRGHDLFIDMDGARVIRLVDVASGAEDVDHYVVAQRRDPWVVVGLVSQERIEQEEDEPPAHPEVYFTQWLVDTRSGRVGAMSSETLPSWSPPEAPTWTLGPAGAEIKLMEESASILFADITRCAGTDKDADGAVAKRWLDLGRKLTSTENWKARAAFTQALAFDPGLAEAYSGRGYAQLLAYKTDLERDATSIGHVGALADFEEAVARSKDPKFLAAVYFNIGETHRLNAGAKLPKYKAEALAKAIAAYERSLEHADRPPVRAQLEATRKALASIE